MADLRQEARKHSAYRLDAVADVLNAVRQHQVCSYRADEVGEGKQYFCDCKYGGPVAKIASEQNGCPELRDVVVRFRRAAIDLRREDSC